jgi:transposase-like protein
MVDYQQRTAYLLSLEGGNISALARSTGVSRRTLRRMLQGRESTGGRQLARSFDPDVRNRINRNFRRKATPRARRDERKERGIDRDQVRILPELSTYQEAQRIFRTFQRLDLNVSVSGQVSVAYKDDTGEIPLDMVETEFTTLYTQGIRQPSVDEALENLEGVLTQFINADHQFFGNSPTRIIIDPIPNGDPDEGSSYSQAFLYRVYRPVGE